MSDIPRRAVIRVLDLEGQRGGITRVLFLECGCTQWKSVRHGKAPPRSIQCIGCGIAAALTEDDKAAIAEAVVAFANRPRSD
jgi:hypothetical protein